MLELRKEEMEQIAHALSDRFIKLCDEREEAWHRIEDMEKRGENVLDKLGELHEMDGDIRYTALAMTKILNELS